MAWTTMHFAVGMGGAGTAALGVCAITRRGWRLVPAAMTFGGIWTVAPDLPRVFHEDFPSLPFAALFGDRNLEKTLHAFGDLFFFHARLDAAPHEYALHGLVLILLFYYAATAGLLWLERRRWTTAPPMADTRRLHRLHPRKNRGPVSLTDRAAARIMRVYAFHPANPMARAQVDPEDLKRFSRELRQFNTDLESMLATQRARVAALGNAWQDQESRRFTEQFDQMLKVLHRMLESSNEHAALLTKKAGHIEQYLRQR